MPVTDPSLKAAILLSRAAWAGDWAYADELAVVAQDPKDKAGIPPTLLKLGPKAKVRLLEGVARRAKAEIPNLIKGESIYAEEMPNVSVLAGRHIRAVVTQPTNVDFEVRAYAFDLDWHPQLQKIVRAVSRFFPTLISYSPQSASARQEMAELGRPPRGGVFVIENWLQQIVRINSLSLIRISARSPLRLPMAEDQDSNAMRAAFADLKRTLSLLDGGSEFARRLLRRPQR